MKFSLTFSVFLLTTIMLVSVVSAATVTIRPNGYGANQAWTNINCGSGLSEWQCVDEAAANTTDYLRAADSSRETFTFSNTNLTNVIINNVRIFYYAMQHNGGSNSCFAAMTRSGGTDYLSGVQMCVGTSWVYRNHTYTTNPATGSAWTISQVEALEAGMYGLNPNDGGRVSQVYAVVNYTVQPTCVRSNPAVIISPGNKTGAAGSTLQYSTSVKNFDSTGCGSSVFGMSYSIPAGWSASFGNTSMFIAPGTTATTTFSITSVVNATAGGYSFTNTATNNGNTSYFFTNSSIYTVLP